MWSREILKANAKTALRGRYWTAFAVTLVALLITSAYSAVTEPYNYRRNAELFLNPETLPSLEESAARSGADTLISVGSLVFTILVITAILVGLARFFLHNRFGVTNFSTLFSGFRMNYGNTMGAMAVTMLFIGLWTLLFVIPGIVKSLQYSMVRFILADNPNIPGARAREISRAMTDGEKGAIFVLLLSFLGWFLLGALCFGVGILFVLPYVEATFAELYVFLRDRAIQTGRLNPAELGLTPPAGPAPV